MTNAKKQTFLIILVFCLFFLNVSSLTAAVDVIELNLEYPKFGDFDPDVNQDLNEISAWFYYFFIAISGVFAFFGLVSGGFVRLTSEGNPARIADANDRINSALLGLIIILASYLILKTINPELTILDLKELTSP